MAQVTQRVREILSWYRYENTGVLTNLFRIMNTGTLAGTGKFVILPVDQGFEHGPGRSFAANPAAYDASYFFELALESGCNAYAAPYGQLITTYPDYVGQIPLIVKVNNSDTLYPDKNPEQAITCSVKEALRMGAAGIGYTIYPGSSHRKDAYEEIREMAEEARSYGLAVVVWSYARGEAMNKDAETAVDTISYAAHIAAQLGAHIIKVKPPTAHVFQDAHKKAFEKANVKLDSLADRAAFVIQGCFGGRRIVIFSGGEAKGEAEVLEEVKALAAGGSFGSIMGRNAFQRPKAEGVKLLKQVMAIYKG